MWNARLNAAQAGVKISGRNINNLRHGNDTTLMAESKEELKSLLMKVKEEKWKRWFKTTFKIYDRGIWSHHFMADRETMETVRYFLFLGSKITADGDYKHEIKKLLAPWEKSCDQPRQHIKSRDITLPRKICLIKAMVFPAVMYGCEFWTIKKAECWKTNPFELWCWRRLLRAP